MNPNNIYNNGFISIILITVSFSAFCNHTVLTEPLNGDETSSSSPQLEFNSGIRSILQDRQGNYWFGSHNEGVAVFNGETFTYFTTKDGLSDNQIRTIQEHKDGSIWFGTGNGVSSYDSKSIKNHHGSDNFIGLEPISPVGTYGISDQELWFNAGNKSGVYRLKNHHLSYVDFPIQGDMKNNLYSTTAHTKGNNDNVWIASFSAVFGYDGKSFTIIDDQSLAAIKPLNSMHVRSIFEDSKGNLWIGNNGIGVLLKTGNTIINFSAQYGLIHADSKGSGDVSPSGTLEHVFAIEEDSSGNIWFGDRDTGVWKFDGDTMTNYTVQDGLSSNSVMSIYKDKNGSLWLGLNDGSVYIFKDHSFKRKFSSK